MIKKNNSCLETKEEIEAYVNEIREHLNTKVDLKDVGAVINSFGFNIEEEKINRDIYSLVFADHTLNDKIMIVNGNLRPDEKRYTLARELGYYLLYGVGKHKYHHETIKSKINEENIIEQEVSCFANNLLMPKDEMRKYYNIMLYLGYDTDDMIECFQEEFGPIPNEILIARMKEFDIKYKVKKNTNY